MRAIIIRGCHVHQIAELVTSAVGAPLVAAGDIMPGGNYELSDMRYQGRPLPAAAGHCSAVGAPSVPSGHLPTGHKYIYKALAGSARGRHRR